MALSRTVKLIEDKLGLDDADSSTIMVRVNNLCALLGDGGETQLMRRIQWLAQEVNVSSTSGGATAAAAAAAASTPPVRRLSADLSIHRSHTPSEGGEDEEQTDEDEGGDSDEDEGGEDEVKGAAEQGRPVLPLPSSPPPPIWPRPQPAAAPPPLAAPKPPPPPQSPSPASAFLFIANAQTQDEVFRREIFALPERSFTDMQRILPSTTLLLYNRSSRQFLGPFVAVGRPGLDIAPGAFGGRFRAQLRFRLATPSMRTVSEANLQIWRSSGGGGAKNSRPPSSPGFLGQSDAELLRSWFLEGDPLAHSKVSGGAGSGSGGDGDGGSGAYDGRGSWRGGEVHLKLVAWGVPNPAGVARLLYEEEMDSECLGFSTVADFMDVGLEEHIATILFGAIQGTAKAIAKPEESLGQQLTEQQAASRPAPPPPPPQGPAVEVPRKATKLCNHWKKSGTCRFGKACHFAHSNDEMRNGRSSGAAVAAAAAAAPAAPAAAAAATTTAPLSQPPTFHIPSSLAPTITDSVLGTNSDFTGTRTLLNLSRTATNLDTVIYASSKQRKAHRKITGFEVERARRYGSWVAEVAKEKDVVAGIARKVGEALMVCQYRDTIVTFSSDRSAVLESHRKGTKLSRTQTIFANGSSGSSSGSSSSSSSSVEKGAETAKEESSAGAAAAAKKGEEPVQDSPAPPPRPPPKASGKKRTQLCASWRKTKSCAAGDKCLFAHGKSELGTYQSSVRGQPQPQPQPQQQQQQQQSQSQQSQQQQRHALNGGGGGFAGSAGSAPRSFPPRWWKPPHWSSSVECVEPTNDCSSHTVLVVDASGSIRRSLASIMGLLSSEFATPQVKAGSVHDAVSLILMRDGDAELVFHRRPLTTALVYDLWKAGTSLTAKGDGNYIPALDFVEKATAADSDMDYATILMFLSDGAPSDDLGSEDAFVERLGIDSDAVKRLKGQKKRSFLMGELASKRMRNLRSACGPARFRLVAIAVGDAFDTTVLLAMTDSVRGTFRASFGGQNRLRSAFNVVSETLTATKTSISESQLHAGGSRTQRRDVNVVKQSSASQFALDAFAEEDEEGEEETDSEDEGVEYQYNEKEAAAKSDLASPVAEEARAASTFGAAEIQSIIELLEAEPQLSHLNYCSFDSWKYHTRETNETEAAEEDESVEPVQEAQRDELLHPFSKGAIVASKKHPNCSYSLTGQANRRRGGECYIEVQQLSGKGMKAHDKSPRIFWLDKAWLKPLEERRSEKGGTKQKPTKKKKKSKVDDDADDDWVGNLTGEDRKPKTDDEKKSTSQQVLEGIFETMADTKELIQNEMADKTEWVQKEVERRRAIRRAVEAEKRAAQFLQEYEEEDRKEDRRKSTKSKSKGGGSELAVGVEKKTGWLSPGTKTGSVRVTKDAFHEGAERMVFYVKKQWEVNGKKKTKNLVGKEPKTEEDLRNFGSDMMAYHKTFAETSQMAVNLANAFMRSVKNHHLQVCHMKFLEPEIIKVQDDRPVYNGERWLYCETNLKKITKDADFLKWNSNAGQIFKQTSCKSSETCGGESRLAKMKYSDVLQCFSHWTFEHTNEAMLVCDLQGIFYWGGEKTKSKKKDGEQEKAGKKIKPRKKDSSLPTFMLTDPVIHKSQREDDEDRQGRTDLGETGIIHFFETHQCNELCRALKLQDRADWVAARTCKILKKGKSARYAREEENRTAEQCKAAGYSLKEMREGGYGVHEIFEISGMSIAEMRSAGFVDIQEYRAAGETATSLAKGGFGHRTIIEAGYTPLECRAAGIEEDIIISVHGEKSTKAGGNFCLGEMVYAPDYSSPGYLVHACVIGRGKVLSESDYFPDDWIQVKWLNTDMRTIEENVRVEHVHTERGYKARETAAKAADLRRKQVETQRRLMQIRDRKIQDASRKHRIGDLVKILIPNNRGARTWQHGRVTARNIRHPDMKEEEPSLPYAVQVDDYVRMASTSYHIANEAHIVGT